MDSAKPEAATDAATDADTDAATDNQPDGRFSYSAIYQYLRQKSYPANLDNGDKRALRKRAQHFTCQDGELYYVGGVSSKL